MSVNRTEKLASGKAFDLVQGLTPLPASLSGPVVAIGNFDGLHRGHRAVIDQTQNLAARLSAPAAVLTFEPHPRAYFKPDEALFELTPIALKASILAQWNVNGMIVLPFNAEMAATSAPDFVENILIKTLGVTGIVVGHDFHFGRGREGSPDALKALGAQNNLPVEIVTPLVVGKDLVSSSAIRAALTEGDVGKAARLLGYRWLVRGEIIHGEKIGRTLGYPTANIRLSPNCQLKHGIYAVRLAVDGVVHTGVASYGRRPTFDNGAPLLEVFVFDFKGDLYGKTIDVEFCAFLRGERKFDGIDPLIEQMDLDSRNAREALARNPDIPAPSLLPLAPASRSIP